MINFQRTIDRLIYYLRMYSWLIDPRRFSSLRNTPIDRPIFILGVQGGGLTLLSRMLRRHPDAVSAAGGRSYWTAADEIQNVYWPILPPALTGTRFKAPYHPTLTAPRSWTYAVGDLLPQYRQEGSYVDSRVRDSLLGVIRYSVARFAKTPSARFIDKSQTFCLRVGLLQAVLGEFGPKYVIMTRDPYIAVFRAAHGKAGDMARLSKLLPIDERIDICAQHWANSYRTALSDIKRLGIRPCIVRFEDLVNEPESTLKSVCQHVELTFSSGMLPHSRDRLPFGSRFHDRWYPIDRNVNDRYSDRLDEKLIERVNCHAGKLVADLGYTIM